MNSQKKQWITNLAMSCTSRPIAKSKIHELMQQAVVQFLEELCFIVVDCVNQFNELVYPQNLDMCCHLFKLHPPRAGLILLKGKDKLVISMEGRNIKIRMLQVQLYGERPFQTLEFEPNYSELGIVSWHCTSNNQYVNPELIAEIYLASFLVSGCSATIPSFLKLVAASK